MKDLYIGVIKSICFGLICVICSTYCGYFCFGGAKGVGFVTTKAVALSFALVLLANYFITFVNN